MTENVVVVFLFFLLLFVFLFFFVLFLLLLFFRLCAMFAFYHICSFIISGEFDALHQLSVKKDPLEMQHPKLENGRRGFIESVHER